MKNISRPVFCIIIAIISTAYAACAPKTLTVAEKLTLNGQYNDHDHNGIVTYADVAFDLDHNYDANKDGKVTEAEWIARWTCAFGDSVYMARFSFNQIGGGFDIIKTNFNIPPFSTTGIPLANFITMNHQRYDQFHQMQCVNHDLSLQQKLDLNQAYNNHNHDSVVDSSDIAYDLIHNFDLDSDGRVTLKEWVTEFCCAYGDSSAFAIYKWNTIASGKEYIQPSDFAGPPFDHGIPVANFRQSNLETYEAFAAQVPVGKRSHFQSVLWL